MQNFRTLGQLLKIPPFVRGEGGKPMHNFRTLGQLLKTVKLSQLKEEMLMIVESL